MPRRDIPFVPDHFYHLYNRGNNRQSIFFEPDNYAYFLRGIKRYVSPFASVVAYCLMPTHYHLVVRVKQTSEVLKTSVPQTSEVLETSEVSRISNAMMRLSVSYTKAINKRFARVGSLFQGQFQAKPVTRYEYLLNLCLYIHGNPVKDGLVSEPADWPYSNYLEWIGERNGTLFDREFMQEHFGSADEYKTSLTEYLKSRYLPEDVMVYLRSLEK